MVIVTSRIRRRTSPSVPFRASGVAAHGAWPRRRGGDCDTDDKHGQQRGSDPAHGLPQEHVRDDELISAGASLTSVEAWLAHRCTPAVALSGHPDCRVSSVLNPQSYETLTPRPDASRRRKSAARVASAGRRGRSDLPDVNPPVVKPLFPDITPARQERRRLDRVRLRTRRAGQLPVHRDLRPEAVADTLHPPGRETGTIARLSSSCRRLCLAARGGRCDRGRG